MAAIITMYNLKHTEIAEAVIRKIHKYHFPVQMAGEELLYLQIKNKHLQQHQGSFLNE